LFTFSALFVTAIHFTLTFVSGIVNPEAFTHYRSETVAKPSREEQSPALCSTSPGLGHLLMTSIRFLISDYLCTGDRLSVADMSVRRTFRLIVPVTAVVLLEYFFVDTRAVKWLEYLPSITWSTWPFAVKLTDLGKFPTEIFELAFLIPNAVPRITNNFCSGVLWTIPVQLRESCVALLAVVVTREIRTP